MMRRTLFTGDLRFLEVNAQCVLRGESYRKWLGRTNVLIDCALAARSPADEHPGLRIRIFHGWEVTHESYQHVSHGDGEQLGFRHPAVCDGCHAWPVGAFCAPA